VSYKVSTSFNHERCEALTFIEEDMAPCHIGDQDAHTKTSEGGIAFSKKGYHRAPGKYLVALAWAWTRCLAAWVR
ncbi:unnamed protein product, partial [Symbiodinium microadriaticum]